MKAMQIDRFGDSTELKLREIEPTPSGDQTVRIKMAYASINPADWKVRAGLLPHYFERPFPLTLGMDGSGIVEAIGEGVTAFQPGDRVITLSGFTLGFDGTYAEYCVAPAPRIFLLPGHLTLAEGATIPIAGASAASSILEVAACKNGDRVFVNGGAGSVGTFAIQFLKYLGCEVAASCSSRNLAYLQSLGADLVIDYTSESIPERLNEWAPKGLTSVIDAVGQHSLPHEMPELIQSGGFLVVVLNLLTGPEAFDLELAEKKGVRVVDNVSYAMTENPIWFQVEALRQLLSAISKKKVGVPPYRVIPLDEAGRGQDEVEQGHVRGKILLKIAGGE